MKTPIRVKAYAAAVLLFSVVAAAAFFRLVPQPFYPSPEFVLVLVLGFLFAHFPIKVTPDGAVTVILLMPLVLAFVVIKGSPFGIIVAVSGSLISSVLTKHTWEKTAFNAGLVLLEATMAAVVFRSFGHVTVSAVSLPLLAALLLMSAADWLVNVGLFAGLISLLSHGSYWRELIDIGKPAIKHIFVDTVIAILVFSINESMGLPGLLLMATLLFLTRYGFQSYYELRTAYEEVQEMLISILDARDAYTAGHSARVAENAVRLAVELKLPPREIENLRRAALLHDIGKVNVPDQVLKKPGKLSEEETVQMNQHPVDGARFVDSVSSLKHLTPIILHHHERLDGKGYPEGLKGVEIPFGARILLVADAFDAMTTDRPYRGAMTRAEALRRIIEGAGTQFDPTVAWAAVRVFGAELPEYAELKALQQWVEREAAATRQVDPPEGKA